MIPLFFSPLEVLEQKHKLHGPFCFYTYVIEVLVQMVQNFVIVVN